MKNVKRTMVIVGILLFVIGILVLFNGANIGLFLAEKAIHANGGSMDTQQYHFIMESNTLSYQLGGAIIAIIGGICAVLFGYKSVK